MVTLWAITVFLVKEKKNYFVTLIPALFMTMVCSIFIFIAKKEGLGLDQTLSYCLGAAITAITLLFFCYKLRQWRHTSAI
jgi:carbon starvation protein CstA